MATERDLSWYTVRWSKISENHQGRVNTINHVDRDADLVPACTCRLVVWRAQQRNSGTYQQFCSRESSSSSPCPDTRQCNLSLYFPGTFQASVPSLELWFSVCAWMSLCLSPFRMPKSTATFHLTWIESLPKFSPRCCGNSSILMF